MKRFMLQVLTCKDETTVICKEASNLHQLTKVLNREFPNCEFTMLYIEQARTQNPYSYPTDRYNQEGY